MEHLFWTSSLLDLTTWNKNVPLMTPRIANSATATEKISARSSLRRAGRPAAHSDTSGSRKDQPDGLAQSSWADLLGRSAQTTESNPLSQYCYACPRSRGCKTRFAPSKVPG